jgi:hypothetical protein
MKARKFKLHSADEIETPSGPGEMWLNVERVKDGYEFHISNWDTPDHEVTISPEGAKQLRKFLKP